MSDAGGPSQPPALGTKVKRALAWSTINNIAMRFGSLAVGILLAWLLTPEQFGIFAIAMTAQTILVAFADLGLSPYLIRSADIDSRAPTVATVTLGTGVLLSTVVWIFAGPISVGLGSGDAAPVVAVMGLTFALSGLSVVPYAKMQRDLRQSAQFALDGTSLAVSTAVSVALILLGVGPMALAIGRVAAQAVACAMQFGFTRNVPKFGFSSRVAGEMLRFGLPLAGANFIGWIVMSVDYVVVAHVAGPMILGFYVMAFNISSFPMNALGQAVRAVALPGFSAMDGERRRARIFVAAAAVTWAVALLAGILLSTMAEDVIGIVYGQKWMTASIALGSLAFFGALRVVFDLTATFLIAAGATRPVLALQLLWLVALTPAIIVGTRWYGLAGAGWSHVIVGVAVVLPTYALLSRRHQVPLGGLLRDLLVPLIAAVPAFFVAYWAAHVFANPWLTVTVGGVAATLAYALPLSGWIRRRLRTFSGAGRGPVSPPTALVVEPAGAHIG